MKTVISLIIQHFSTEFQFYILHTTCSCKTQPSLAAVPMPLAVSAFLNSGTVVIGAAKQLAELPDCVYEKCWRDACQIQLKAVSTAASSSLFCCVYFILNQYLESMLIVILLCSPCIPFQQEPRCNASRWFRSMHEVVHILFSSFQRLLPKDLPTVQ